MKKMRIKFLAVIVSIGVVAVILSSCMKDKFEFDKISMEAGWSPSIGLPVAFGKLNVYNIVTDYDSTGLINIGDDGIVYLQYNREVISLKGEDIIDLPNQTFPHAFTGQDANNVGGFSGNTVHMTSQLLNNFSVDGQQYLDSIVFKGNTMMKIDVASTFLHTGTLVITFPELKKNGQVYSKTININSSAGNFVSHNEYIDLAGYTLDLSNLGVDTNKVLVKYDLTLTNSGSGVIDNANYCGTLIEFADIEFQALYGYIGYRDLDLPTDSVDIDIFNEIFDGAFYFRNPNVKIYTHNSYGLPIKYGFNSVSAYSLWYDQYINLVGLDLPLWPGSPKILAYPSFSEIGQTAEDSIYLDGDNSNIDDVISTFPKYISFDVDAAANADNIYDNENFVLDSSAFDVDMEVRIPLWGSGRYFRLADTVDADMHEVVDSNEIIEQIIFRLVAFNGMPFEVSVQGYFCDSLYNVIDSLITDGDTYIINSGIVDGNGRVDQVTGTTLTFKDFIFPAERIDKLKDVRKVIFYSRGYTTHYSNAENIRIYSDYTIQLNLGLRIDADVATTDDF